MSHKRKVEGDPMVELETPAKKHEGGEENEDDSEESSNDGDASEEGDGDEDESSEVELDEEETKAFVSAWMESKRDEGVHPKQLLDTLGIDLPMDPKLPLDEAWTLLEHLLSTSTITLDLFDAFSAVDHRRKLPHINTFEDVVELLRNSSHIVILTGAGVSVSCGIPDFRSPGGLYEQVEEKYNLPDPQCLFDIHYLRDDPQPFFEFAREIYPGNHKPSPTHYFIKELDRRGKLLRNYTQNIDTLEIAAGINTDKVVNCHGSFATASCVVCKKSVDCEAIRDDIMNMKIPQCASCQIEGSFMKPDIVFFGEPLPERFGKCFAEDSDKVDLLIVMGSSLKVQPVALIPELTDGSIPQILVNREVVAHPHEFDHVFLGDCDQFVIDVCQRLNWTINGLPPEHYQKKTDDVSATKHDNGNSNNNGNGNGTVI